MQSKSGSKKRRALLVTGSAEVAGLVSQLQALDPTLELRVELLEDDPSDESGLTVVDRLLKRGSELEDSRIDTLFRLGKAAEFRDKDTGYHVFRVGFYARELAETLGLDREFVRRLFLVTPLHDIGKIGVPDDILLKRGKLDEAEWVVMRRHCELGAQLLSETVAPMDAYFGKLGRESGNADHMALRQLAATVALTHHERWDGSGYPNGLSGEQIPIEGRIVAVADVYDAMLTPRPYKAPHPEREVVRWIRDQAGRHFDPEIVAAFEKALTRFREISESYQSPPQDLAEWLKGA